MTATETPLGVRLTSYVPHWPHPPQEAFLWLNQLEAFYGGAAGGGKSDALLMAALQYVDVPNYAALLLRKTYADLALPGAIMDRSKTWLMGSDAHWNDNAKQWTFPSGATITFGYLQTANHKVRYQGAEFQMIGFDELTQFEEPDYAYLLSRLRRPADGPLSLVPLRMRAASNPGGRGHKWVKRRFIQRKPNPDDPEDTPEKCAARVFIPSRLDDNPSVDQAAYTAALGGLDPQTRAQLLAGDWNARQPGNYVYPVGLDAAEKLGAKYDELLAKGNMVPPAGEGIAIGIDWGIGTTACVPIWPLAGGGVYVPPGEVIVERGEPTALTNQMLEMAAGFDPPLLEARYDAAGAQQMQTFGTVAPESVGIYRVDFNRRKRRTIGFIRQLLQRAQDGETTQILAVSPQNTVLLDQLRGLRLDSKDPDKVVKENDHAPDALIAGVWPIAAEFPDLDPRG